MPILAKRPPLVTVLLIRFRLIFTPQSRRIHLFDGTVIVHDSHVSYIGMNEQLFLQSRFKDIQVGCGCRSSEIVDSF